MMRDVAAGIAGVSGARGCGTGNGVCPGRCRWVVNDTGNRVCVDGRRAVNDTGNGVWGSRERASQYGFTMVPVCAGVKRSLGRGTGNRVCVPGSRSRLTVSRLRVRGRCRGGCA